MIEMGILDPAKVTRTALQAAGSVAGLMITTEVMVCEAVEEGGSGGGGVMIWVVWVVWVVWAA